MDPLSPVMQYGPNDGGYAVALQLLLVVIGLFACSWLLGAAYTLILKSFNANKKSESEWNYRYLITIGLIKNLGFF